MAHEQKTATVIVLPPQTTLPVGHVLLVASKDGKVKGTRHWKVLNESQISLKLLEIQAKGSAWDIEYLVSARINYKKVLTKFKHNPLQVVEAIRSFGQK